MDLKTQHQGHLQTTCLELEITWVHAGVEQSESRYTPEKRPDMPTTLVDDASDDLVGQLLFGNWTIVCSPSMGICRMMGHVAVDCSAPLVVNTITGGGEISLDSGSSFKPGGELTWLSYFDGLDDMDLASSSSTISQRHHWSYDSSFPFSFVVTGTLHLTEICYMVWFTDPTGTTGNAQFVNMTTQDPPHYSGYAKSESVRCWPVNDTSIIMVE